MNLDDILLYPAEINNGFGEKKNFAVLDDDKNSYLPIFTSPSDSIIGKENWKIWADNGIRPILPISEPLEFRLEGSQYIFSEFTLQELIDNFIRSRKNPGNNIFRVSIYNFGNGEDVQLFQVASELKKIYGPKIQIMAGNLGNPDAYISYCKSKIDFVRVGLDGSLVNQDKFGFGYSLPQLLIAITGKRQTTCIGLQHTKIIADGGIHTPADILKAMCLGADYVMLGRTFAEMVEASGEILQKAENKSFETISKSALTDMTRSEIRSLDLKRYYVGTFENSPFRNARTAMVPVNNTLHDWIVDLSQCLDYGFSMAGATDWKTFKEKIKYTKNNG